MVERLTFAAILLTCLLSVAIASDEFIELEVCAHDDEHKRDRQEILVRKSFVVLLQPAGLRDRECVLVATKAGRRVFVYGTLEEVRAKIKDHE